MLKRPPIPKQLLEKRLEIAAIIAALATVPLTIAQTRGVEDWWVLAGDWIVWSVFFIEYVVLMWVSSNRWGTTRTHWLSVAIIILSFPLLPALFAATRLARLLRLVRLFRLLLIANRGMRAIKAVLSQNEVIYVATVATFLVFVAGGILSVVEPQHGGFWSSVWWATVTVTTVGYGDIAPESPLGRTTAVFLMLVGIGLVATLAAAMASYFVGTRDETPDEIAALHERLERIERLLLDQGVPGQADKGRPAASGDDDSG